MSEDDNERVFEKIRLKNTLDLKIFFRSKHIAGDRCQVTFEAVVEVPVVHNLLDDSMNINDVQRLLGEKTAFKFTKTRNFIAEDNKEEVLENLRQQFFENNLNYISSPAFPERLIKRNYSIAINEETIRIRRLAALEESDPDIKRAPADS